MFSVTHTFLKDIFELMHSLRLLCRCMGYFSWGEFISIISLIIFLLHILSSHFVFSRSCRFILLHICLYSLVCICEFLCCVLSLSIIVLYVNNHGLISKLGFLFSILIIPFEILLFLFFFVLIASLICLSLLEVCFSLIFIVF